MNLNFIIPIKIKYKSTIVDALALQSAIDRHLSNTELIPPVLYVDLLINSMLFKINQELKKKILKVEGTWKKLIPLEFSVFELLLIDNQIKYKDGDPHELRSILIIINKDAICFQHIIKFGSEQEPLKMQELKEQKNE